jgi:hypothetical protein
MRGQWVLLGVAVVLAVAAVPLQRAWLLGAIGGLGFGVVAVAARVLTPSLGGDLRADVVALLEAPATYALLVAAPLGLVAYATSLQRGGVVEATAPLVVTETVLPAAVGLTLLGDHARAGWGAVAALGFALGVGGTVVLSRFGEVEEPVQTSSG